VLDDRTMIEHVYRRAEAARLGPVLVATDDDRIRAAVERFGGDVRMTKREHRSGTERLAELATGLSCDLVVNVQGDEPLIDPRTIAQAAAPLAGDPTIPIGTVRRRIADPAELASPHVVKVVVDRDDFALYFSRAPIPHARAADRHAALGYKHIGLYVYRREVLVRLAALPPTPLERAEVLEQLRALEHGYRIKAVETEWDSVGVDTPEDLERVRRLLAARPAAASAG